MIRSRKYAVVAERISRRIRAGDYHLQPVPAERELAAEVGVSHTTARKAIQCLLDEGLLCRLENGRLAVRRGDRQQRKINPQLALLAPAWESSEVTRWAVSITQLCPRFECSFRLVHYVHWDDPILTGSLERFDGAFLLPVPQKIPQNFMSRLLRLRRPIVTLGHDWTEYGIPSVRLFPPTAVQKLLDHLVALGHRNIDCFNVQPTDSIISSWIGQWNIWRAARGIEGELIDAPVPAYTETLPVAYDVIAMRLRAGKLRGTAMLCTTERGASGAMRALVDHGLRIGHDVALCVVDDSGRGDYLIPSVTSLQTPDPRPFLAVCLEWMLAGKNRHWNGSLLVQPTDLPIEIRQSTQPNRLSAPAQRLTNETGNTKSDRREACS